MKDQRVWDCSGVNGVAPMLGVVVKAPVVSVQLQRSAVLKFELSSWEFAQYEDRTGVDIEVVGVPVANRPPVDLEAGPVCHPGGGRCLPERLVQFLE